MSGFKRLIRIIIPVSPARAAFIGMTIGIVATIALFIPDVESGDTAGGLAFWIVLPVLMLVGSLVWFFLNQLLYDGKRGKETFIIGFILLLIYLFTARA
jgi:hypothetical protein